MTKFALMFSLSVVLLSGCVSNTVNVTPEVSTSEPAKAKVKTSEEKRTINNSVTVEYSANSKPISVIVLDAGPCPERDPKSYGLLMQSRTVVRDGKVRCYYN